MKHCGDEVNSFYISQQVYKNLPVDIIEAERCSISVYKRRVSEWLLRLGPEAAEMLIQSPYT